MNDKVVTWLESPIGERWSRMHHADLHGFLMSVKDDEIMASDGITSIIWYASA